MAGNRYSPNDPKDVLLANVAIGIQLSPTNHRLANERLTTLAEWINRPGSPLTGLVDLVYPQGSMAIHATIASALRNDEFDVDAVVQTRFPLGTTARKALDLLFLSVRGEPGSRYYGKTKRNTRCVTVEYAGMHVDLTPGELLPGRDPRVTHIFHHRPEEPHTPGKRVTANPFGFAEWFTTVTPRSPLFEEFFGDQSLALDRQWAKAETEEVPAPIPAYQKPPAVISLQLIKRYRNVRYDRRPGRKPPSVLLAYLAAKLAGTSASPFLELLHQCRQFANYFQQHQNANRLIHVQNPRCPEDVFTDRWPCNLEEQGLYLQDLQFMVAQLERIESGAQLEVIAEVFSKLFGEEIAKSVIAAFNEESGRRIAQGSLLTDRGTGRIELRQSHWAKTSATAAAAPPIIRASPPHTFYGPE